MKRGRCRRGERDSYSILSLSALSGIVSSFYLAHKTFPPLVSSSALCDDPVGVNGQRTAPFSTFSTLSTLSTLSLPSPSCRHHHHSHRQAVNDDDDDAISSATPQAARSPPLQTLPKRTTPRLKPPTSSLAQTMGRLPPPALAHYHPSFSRHPRHPRSYPCPTSPRRRLSFDPRCIRRHPGPLGLWHAMVSFLHHLPPPVNPRSLYNSSSLAAISTPGPIQESIGGRSSSVHPVNLLLTVMATTYP